MACLLHHDARGLDPRVLDRRGGGLAGFGTKRAAELARAEIGHAGEFFDRQFGSKIAPRIAKRRLDPVTLGIEFEQRRMLGLAAGPAMMQIGSASCRERVCQYV